NASRIGYGESCSTGGDAVPDVLCVFTPAGGTTSVDNFWQPPPVLAVVSPATQAAAWARVRQWQEFVSNDTTSRGEGALPRCSGGWLRTAAPVDQQAQAKRPPHLSCWGRLQ